MTVPAHFSGNSFGRIAVAPRRDGPGLFNRLFGVAAFFFSYILFFSWSLAWGISETPTSFRGESRFQDETEAHEITGTHFPGDSFSRGAPAEDGQGAKAAGLQDSPKPPSPEAEPDKKMQGEDNYLDKEESESPLPDPLEPMNRAFFHFNDKLYFWILKPVGQGYEIGDSLFFSGYPFATSFPIW